MNISREKATIGDGLRMLFSPRLLPLAHTRPKNVVGRPWERVVYSHFPYTPPVLINKGEIITVPGV